MIQKDYDFMHFHIKFILYISINVNAKTREINQPPKLLLKQIKPILDIKHCIC